MGIKETNTKEVSVNSFASEIIQKTNNIELQTIQRNGMCDRLIKYFEENANDPDKGAEEVISGYIDKLAEVDSRFTEYQR